MMNRFGWIVVASAIASFAGCSKKEPANEPPAAPQCAPAIEKAMARLPANPELGSQLKAVMIKRCTEDKWSADVLKCYEGLEAGSGSPMMAMRGCREKLPKEQSDRLRQDIQQVMVNQRGSMGRPGMAPPAGGSGSSPPVAAPPSGGSASGPGSAPSAPRAPGSAGS